MCCIPRPDPFCNQCEQSRNPKKTSEQVSEQDPGGGSSPRKYQNNNNNNNKSEQPQTQQTPIVVPIREEEPLDVDEPSITMNNKNNDVNNNDEKAKINDEEFLEGDVPPATASRVEVKEKTFPDGSRQLEETTHFHDGTTSVKNTSFHK
jgi:hypothetical protein